jgi:hypothetical protein
MATAAIDSMATTFAELFVQQIRRIVQIQIESNGWRFVVCTGLALDLHSSPVHGPIRPGAVSLRR